MKGIAPDGGLFMPIEIPALPDTFFESIHELTLKEIAYKITELLISEDIPKNHLHNIIDSSVTFPAPTIDLSPTINVLELWHGPSLAFKDFGAQFMAQIMAYFNRLADRPLNILVATSGDTGGAVAAGFHNVEGINVVILFPKGKVSSLQEKQLTTFGGNVTAIEIDGTFDDCQALVKRAFNDPDLSSRLRLTSANSINISRLIPQSFYYFEGVKTFIQQGPKVVVSVPSGNFGNLTAGLIAKRMGLKIHKFIASTNINDIVPHYLNHGDFIPKPSQETLSNAMDVGNPSNFTRMLELYGSTWNLMKNDIIGFSFNDNQTLDAISNIFHKHNYIADPHSAVAYLGLIKFLDSNKDCIGLFLETAHPSKFKATIDLALNIDLTVHEDLLKLSKLPSNKVVLSNNYESLADFLTESV